MYSKNCMVELHCHLDGSLPLPTVRALIDEQSTLFSKDELKAFGKKLESFLVAPYDCSSLEEYLKCFSLPLRLLQTPSSMWLAGRGLAEELKEQGIRYAEIRFAPQLHSRNVEDGKKYQHEKMILESLLAGVKYATKFSHTKINVILCFMRNLPEGNNGVLANYRTLFLAREFLGNGVVGVDLAGAEARDATSEFENYFRAAKELEIPFTIHAGEAGDKRWRVDSIERAIAFGAKRIGHGVGLENSKELRHIVKEANIVVECCPTSNLHTKAIIGGIEVHPIKMFLDEGIKVTVNTDNMTVSNTTLSKEYDLLKSGLGISDDDILLMQMNAIDGAFISESERSKIKKSMGMY